MKKIFVLVLCIALLAGITVISTACKQVATPTYEIALITDIGTINDKSFNQGAWEGVVEYAEANDKTYKYYQPLEKTTNAYIDAIDLAVAAGAKIIVTPGFLFEPAVFVAQDTYPNIKFVLLDGSPNNGDYDNFVAKLNSNVYSIFYAEEQSGFLAGYAAVKDGYTKLGFMGGMAVPAVVRFGYGFVQGANYAATEMGLADGAIDINYFYTGNFNASAENQSKAAGWYTNGTQVIFACGGAVGNSVMAAAAAATPVGKVIGVDVDQSAESATVITSAMKMLGNSVIAALTSYYAGTFPGGQSVSLDAADAGVGLPLSFTKFTTFNQAAYDIILAKLVANEIEISKDKSGETAVTIETIDTAATKVDVTFEPTPEA